MLLRQRGMRLTIISILEDLAIKLPPVRRNIELVRMQFAQRFKHEDLMMQQITPPGFNAAEKVYDMLLFVRVWSEIVPLSCFLSMLVPVACLGCCSQLFGKVGRTWS